MTPASDGTTVLLDHALPRTLDAITDALLREAPSAPVEVWLFDDAPSRRVAEARLTAAGLAVRVRSAYKPLLHFALEDLDLSALQSLHVEYPVHPAAHPQRFLLEAYPLAGLCENVTFAPGAGETTYRLLARARDGSDAEHAVFAPNVAATDPTGAPVLRPSGWRRDGTAEGHSFPCDFDTLFDAALDAVRRAGFSGPAPFFDRLRVLVELPANDDPLPFGAEAVSLREALHEDLFFSLREILHAFAGAMEGDGTARPGQIVPDIQPGPIPRVRLTLERFRESGETAGAAVALDTAERPVPVSSLRAALDALNGEPFEARSREGRRVVGAWRAGSGPAVLITSGQHANETSGPVGALRAAKTLADKGAAFAIVPVENVDGYELHQRLIAANPFHMHHAARYSALGDDLSANPPATDFERQARAQALALSGAKLHLNLHGYPSHEWTRPLSGYLPRGFEMWTLPKGFFLILCAWPGWEGLGERLLEAVAKDLSADAELVAFNAAQIACARTHTPDAPITLRHGIPTTTQTTPYYQTPLTIITEAPDETVYGQDFRRAHDAQTATVLAAVEAWRALNAEDALPAV